MKHRGRPMTDLKIHRMKRLKQISNYLFFIGLEKIIAISLDIVVLQHYISAVAFGTINTGGKFRRGDDNGCKV